MSDQADTFISRAPDPSTGNLVNLSPAMGRRASEQFDSPFIDSGYTLRDIWEIIKRRRFLVFGCIVLLTLASVVISFALPKRYVAESLAILDTRRPEISQQVSVVPN